MKIAKKTKDAKELIEEGSYKPNELILWKQIFNLPSEPVWYISIILLCYVNTVYYLLTSVEGKCVSPGYKLYTNVLLLLDGLYLVDITMAICAKFIPGIKLEEDVSVRPITILMFEIMSLVPLEKVVNSNTKPTLYCFIRMNRILRMIRIVYFNYHVCGLIYTELLVHIVCLGACALFSIMLCYTIYCTLECTTFDCTYHPCVHIYFMTTMVTRLIGGGCNYFDISIAWELSTSAVCVLIFILIICQGLSTVTLFSIEAASHKISYVHRSNVIKLRHRLFKSPQYLQQASEDVLELTWKHCQGYDENTDLTVLSPALQNEILIDINWPAFQHSKLFRNMDLPFLRHISKHIRQQFFLPGEFLVRKNEWKGKMIYIVSGIIQLLSEEDGESPIMSLTTGTCIGESSLFLNYKSTNSIRCQTFCELHTLEKRSFVKVFGKFPTEYKALQNVIAHRYRYAKATNALANVRINNTEQSVRQTDTYTTFWIKNTLHRLMSRDAETTHRHEFQNIYLLNEVNEDKINKLLFTAMYLDMLVITERIQSDVDTIFIRTSFPCILQPFSILIILWEILVICFAIFLSFAVPIFAFVKETADPWYQPILYVGTIMYWFDLYVQLSTSLRTRRGLYTKFKQIAVARMQSLGFWIDMYTCIPCEVFSPIILSTITSKTHSRMHTNRILKLWRVMRLFKLWEQQFSANIVIIRFVKYTCVMLYTSFISVSLIYIIFDQKLETLIFTTVQIATKVNLKIEEYSDKSYFYLGTSVCYTLIGFGFLASIASAYILKNYSLIKIQQTSDDLLSKINAKGLSAKYNKRITDYLRTQWEDNRCFGFQHKMFSVIYISKLIYDETIDNVIGETLRSLKFFKTFNNDLLLDICGKLALMSFPPNEPITHAGDISRDIIITYMGCYEIISYDGSVSKHVDKPSDVNLLEVLFRAPNYNTCISRTHSRIFKLDYNDLIQVLMKHPNQMTKFYSIIKSCENIKGDLIRTSQLENFSNTGLLMKKMQQKSFYNFGYNLKVDSFEEYDYFIPFDNLYPFSWIRFLLQRFTIFPDGKFLLYWEISRSVLAVISTLMHFTIPIIVITRNTFILDVLNVTAVIDLYIRLHVCYYDAKGLLIKHPLKTAIHYLKFGFLVDFVAVLPLRYFSDRSDRTTYYLLNANILLQLHRYVHLMHHLQSNVIKPSSKYFTLSYIPLLLILANVCGSYFMLRECTFTRDDMHCTNDSILLNSHIERPINIWRAHFFGLFVTTSVLTTCGFQGYSIKSSFATSFLTGLSILGFYLLRIICGYIHTFYTFRIAYLLETQFQIKHLKRFFKLCNVKNELKAYAIKNYELKWKKMGGQSIYVLIEPFSISLKGDILYDFYGVDIYKASPFKSKTKSFYRNLVLHMNHNIIIKGGYLSTINDVENKIYFLLKGVADVILPDGTKLSTIYPGAIFGNMENLRYIRIRTSIIAMTHTEILEISGLKFQEILNFYYQIKEEFCELRKYHLNFIPSVPNEMIIEQFVSAQTTELYRSAYFLRSFDVNSKSMLMWKYFILIYSCFFSILVNLYQAAVYEFSNATVAVQLTSDVLFLVYFITQDRIAYEDESGNLVTDLGLIKMHNRKNKRKLWITLISLIPADIVVYLLPITEHRRNKLFSLLRTNRLLRLLYVLDYFAKERKKINVNVRLTRIAFIIFWSSLSLIGLSTVLTIVSSSIQPKNLIPTVPNQDEIGQMSSMEKFDLFTTFLYITTNCFTLTSQHNYHPEGTPHILIFIALLLVGQMLHMTCICQVFSISYDMNIQKSRFKKKANRIFYYLINGNVSASLIQRVKGYIQAIWSIQEGQVYSTLLDTAPLYLKDAIWNNAFNHIVACNPVFEHCHPDCLRQIIQNLRSRSYFIGDYIQFKGAIDASMYFILTGEVGVLYDEYMHKDDYVRKLSPGNSFGILQGLHHRKPHNYSFRCLTSSIILKLNFDHWEYLLVYYPATRQKIFAAAKKYTDI